MQVLTVPSPKYNQEDIGEPQTGRSHSLFHYDFDRLDGGVAGLLKRRGMGSALPFSSMVRLRKVYSPASVNVGVSQ
jgi:hypothetical protein